MKILRCYPFVPPLKGGMENHVKYLSLKQSLSKEIDVTVFYNQGDKINNQSQQILKSVNLKSVSPQVLRDALFYGAVLGKRLSERQPKYDVMHIHGDWSAFLFGLGVAKLTATPIKVASIHGKLKQTSFSQKIYKSILTKFDVIYCTGLSEVKYLKSLGVDKVVWQPSGVRDEFFQDITEQAKVYDVIGIGSLLPVKNFALFLDVAKNLPSYSFVLIGSGTLEKELKNKCKVEKITNVDFVESLDALGVSQYLSKAKILLSTSLNEGTPTIFLEAMVKGLPIVTTPSNDYSLLIKISENGTIVNSDVDEIREALSKFLENEELYDAISMNNQRKSECFSWEKVAHNVTQMIRDAIKAYY